MYEDQAVINIGRWFNHTIIWDKLTEFWIIVYEIFMTKKENIYNVYNDDYSDCGDYNKEY